MSGPAQTIVADASGRSLARGRAGFSLLELEIAVILLGIALAGLCPLVVMQSRQLKKLEKGLLPGTTYYLTPSRDAWVRKLGAAAAVSLTDPGPAPPPPTMLIDNSDAAYADATGGWATQTDAASYGGDYRVHAQGSGLNTASWTFTGLQPGWYDVEATWVAAPTRGSNVAYAVFDGSTTVATATVDQTSPPGELGYGGVNWNSLGQVQISGTTLVVQVSDNANGQVAADAVRIVALRNTVSVTALGRSLSEDMTAHVTVAWQVPP